jgi:hypothetical protein
VYNYYAKKGSSTPAIKRAIIENDMIEEYHWLPQDIKKIPYRELQMYYLIRKQKVETLNAEQQLQQQINQSKHNMTTSRGQTKSHQYAQL